MSITFKQTVCEDVIGADACQNKKDKGNCVKENVKMDCQLTCGECIPTTNAAPTTTVNFNT